jgi:hypothetical protein
MLFRTPLILLLIFLTATTFAQSRKKKKRASVSQESTQPTALDPLPEKDYAPKASKKNPTKGPTFDSERKYYERKEELEKTRRKNEKLLDKPQYSDPMYFGHKKPPKKRKPSKMRYCKECGIRH